MFLPHVVGVAHLEDQDIEILTTGESFKKKKGVMFPRTNAQWNISDKYERKVDEDTETVVSAGGGGNPQTKKNRRRVVATKIMRTRIQELQEESDTKRRSSAGSSAPSASSKSP